MRLLDNFEFVRLRIHHLNEAKHFVRTFVEIVFCVFQHIVFGLEILTPKLIYLKPTFVYVKMDISLFKIRCAGFPNFRFGVQSLDCKPCAVADTFAMCFGGGYFIRKFFGLNWKLSNLISAGTGICGGSAVAAIAPVIDADDKDVAFAMSSTFLFDMVMIALYPLMGKALGLTDIAYGIWAGTSVNDTASVVASGYAFSEIAGDFATMVKLTRTIAIIPTVLVFAFISTRIKQKELKTANNGQKVKLVKIIPWFIGGFLLLAILNSVGCIPVAISGTIKGASKFLMVTALAAIGLGTSITDFKKAGLKPMFYGITIDTLVTITALVVIWGMGLI